MCAAVGECGVHSPPPPPPYTPLSLPTLTHSLLPPPLTKCSASFTKINQIDAWWSRARQCMKGHTSQARLLFLHPYAMLFLAVAGQNMLYNECNIHTYMRALA
ncbi:hypothetical protein E2C01_003869 [Portunus trituberculatus]|uniref:Uncharacterized protein n=1 Tax=Portunus trituberculatus TaxID=210409 RepID=A0A5B7CND8_PORTR|nr:hypothetical protein [Portunus trituberculatus]